MKIPAEFHLAPFSGSGQRHISFEPPPAIEISEIFIQRRQQMAYMSRNALATAWLSFISKNEILSHWKISTVKPKLATLQRGKTLIASTWQPVADAFRTIRLQRIGPLNESANEWTLSTFKLSQPAIILDAHMTAVTRFFH